MSMRTGFSLIELLVTLAVLAVLATAAAPAAQWVNRRGKEQELRLALREIRTAIDAYKEAYDEGRMPKRLEATGYPPTLSALVQGVRDSSRPDEHMLYFLRRVPRDPFYPDARAPADRTWGLRSYASSSAEPRAGEDVFDVYSLSSETGLNGRPYSSW